MSILGMIMLATATRRINMFLFPGIGLGTLLSGWNIVSDGMLQAAVECLTTCMTEEEVLHGVIYPSISRIRDRTKEVAAEAMEEDLVEGYCEMDARELQKLNHWDVFRTVSVCGTVQDQIKKAITRNGGGYH